MHGLYRQTFYSLLLKCGKISSQQIFTIITHPPLGFKSYARKRLGCFDRFDRDQCLRFLAPFFLLVLIQGCRFPTKIFSQIRFSSQLEFASSQWISPVLYFSNCLCNNSFNVLMKLIHYY